MPDISDNQLADRLETVGSWLLKQRGNAGWHPGTWNGSPTLDASIRGAIFWDEGGSGQEDLLIVAYKTADDEVEFSQVPLDGVGKPTIVDFSNATHDHLDEEGGGVLGDFFEQFTGEYLIDAYGEVGTGNDTATIQAAIDACHAAGGGTVRASARLYRCQGVVTYPGVHVRGAGAGQSLTEGSLTRATTFQCLSTTHPDFQAGVPVFMADDSDVSERWNGGGFSDLAIWGPSNSVPNQPEIANGDVADITGMDYSPTPDGTWLTNVIIENCHFHGLGTGLDLSSGSGSIRYVVISATSFMNCDIGLRLISGHPKVVFSRFRYCNVAIDAHCEDWQIHDTSFGQCNYGIVSLGSPYMERNSIIGNIFYGIFYTALWLGSGNMVIGNTFAGERTEESDANPEPFMVVGTRNNMIVANRFYGANSGAMIQFTPTTGNIQAANIVSSNAVFVNAGPFMEVVGEGTLSTLQVMHNIISVESVGDEAAGMVFRATSDDAGVIATPMFYGNNIRVSTSQTQPLIDIQVPMDNLGGKYIGNRVAATGGATVACAISQSGSLRVGTVIKDNEFAGDITTPIITASPPVSHTIKDNLGYRTENSGTATISSGNSFVDVAHGLAITPVLSSISVTPSGATAAALNYYVASVDATNFRIAVTSPPGSNAGFIWSITSHRVA